MDSIFVKALKRITREEGYDVFNNQDYFFSIVADYIGDRDPNNLQCLVYSISNNLLPSLGDAYRNPRNATKFVIPVKNKIVDSNKFPVETVILFLQSFCDAFGWKVTIESENRQSSAQSSQNHDSSSQTTTKTIPVEQANGGTNSIDSSLHKASATGQTGNQTYTGNSSVQKPKSHGVVIMGIVIAALLAFIVVTHFRSEPSPKPVLDNPTSVDDAAEGNDNSYTDDSDYEEETYSDDYEPSDNSSSNDTSSTEDNYSETESETNDDPMYVKTAVEDYLYAFVNDVRSSSYDEMYSVVESGSNLEQMQKKFIENSTVSEDLLGYEFNDCQKIDNDSYYVTATEKYDITQFKDGVQYYTITQKCTYLVRRQYDGSWKLADLVDINVLDKTEY